MTAADLAAGVAGALAFSCGYYFAHRRDGASLACLLGYVVATFVAALIRATGQ